MRLLSDNFGPTKSCYWTVSNFSDPCEVLVLVSWYCLVCLPCRPGLMCAAMKMSWCRDFSAVDFANRRHIWTFLVASLQSPSSSSCWVREGVQCPTMAAIATLWHLSRALDWASVRLECHTGHPISRWTLPSAVQKLTRVFVSTPSVFILRSTHMVLLAFPTIWVTWEFHPKFDCTIIPKIFISFFSSSIFEPPIVYSGGKS